MRTLLFLAVAVLLTTAPALAAQTCTSAYNKCSRGCMKNGLHPSECVGVYCAQAKSMCMSTGVFATPKGGTICRDCARR
jgi:hypothetical protein